MKHFNHIVLISLLALIGCQKADIANTLPEGLIAFRQEGFPLFNASIQTKATVVDESTLNTSGFNVSCTTGSAGSESTVWNNVAFSKSDGYFVAGGDGKWWPTTDPGYHFYGSNAALTFNADGCTVAATNATDVVCAYLPSPTYKSTNTLAFQHIFARIGTMTFSQIEGYTISNISVYVTPRTGGTYNIRTGAGQTDGTGWSGISSGDAVNIAAQDPGSKSNDIYLVPGRYTLTASWVATKGAYSKVFSNKTCDVDIVAGNINNITASLTGDATAISFSVTVSPWTSNPINIGTYPYAEFSVGSGTTVQFAKGNLQAVIGTGITDYRATASKWKFAEHQYDIIGNAAGNNSFDVGTTVDLFGWVGASASYDSYGLCTNTDVNNAYYGTSGSDALKTDWGSIPGIETWIGSGWRTLTTTEWNYLFTQRANASSLYGQCQITTANGTVTGMLILPDNWMKPSNCTVTPGTGAFDRETYSATAASGAPNAWVDMEAAGAVFLPAAGYRYGASVYGVGSTGYCWSSSVCSEYGAYYVYFYSGLLDPRSYNSRYHGFSVRLVR